MICTPILALWAVTQAPSPVPVKHPRDPFVFRSVLDKRPRMITIALDDDMWVAYDATECALYKAWKGGVLFDGAVYTTVHGPQPTVIGDAYTVGIEGPVWTAFVGGKAVGCKPRYKGYVLDHDAVVLEWEIALEDGRKVEVLELPEFLRPKNYFSPDDMESLNLGEGDQPSLHRILSAKDIPKDVKISLATRGDASQGKAAPGFEHERIEDVRTADGRVVETRVISQAPLSFDRKQNGWVLFFKPIELPVAPHVETKSEKPR